MDFFAGYMVMIIGGMSSDILGITHKFGLVQGALMLSRVMTHIKYQTDRSDLQEITGR